MEDEVPQPWTAVALLEAISRHREAALDGLAEADVIRHLEDDALVALWRIGTVSRGRGMVRKVIDEAGAGWLREVVLARCVETLSDEKRRLVEAEGEASS
jgi:hypothetical protein